MRIVSQRGFPLFILTVAGLGACLPARANTVELLQNASYSYLDGGAFNAFTTENFAQNYASTASLGGGFQTFCIESTVNFNGGQTYYYDLSDVDSLGRPLTLGTAFLYSQFATGVLPGFFTDPDRSAQAGELQAAIWGLQYGQTLSGFPDYTTDPYYLYALGQVGGLTAAETANNETYNVEVLQMWDSDTSHIAGVDDAQNQLVYLGTVPDSANSALLLAGGALALGAARRHAVSFFPAA